MTFNKSGDIEVFIEIEKFSNQKYEVNKDTGKLELDRILPYPYFYPYAYGFIPNTLAMDGDDLDALIITDIPLKKDNKYNAKIVGVLVMEDEKGMDEKVLCVLEEDSINIKDISDVEPDVLDNVKWFFENYKNKTTGKWSKVIGYEDKKYAIGLYETTVIQ
jgi:inorganic pyrophosphatase